MKILFFDLDGTLYCDGRVSDRTLFQLCRVRKNGNALVLNTGRSPAFLPESVAALVKNEFDGMICGSSYVLWRGELLCSTPLSRQTLRRVYEVCLKKRIPVVYEGQEENYSLFGRERDAAQLFASGTTPPVTKVTFWCEPERILDEDFPSLHVIRFRNYAEGILPGFDKSTGMRMIAEAAGIGPGDVWAFGDSENDEAMLRFAGNAVCMAGAPGYFDDFCFYRAKNDEGVAEALEKFF